MPVDPELEELFQQRIALLKHPYIKCHRAVHFCPEFVGPDAVDSVLNELSISLEAAERLINHIHVHDWFHGLEDEERLKTLANEVARAWESGLKAIDPRYRIIRFRDEYKGPALTFYLDRSSK